MIVAPTATSVTRHTPAEPTPRTFTLQDDVFAAQVIAILEITTRESSMAHSRRTWMKTAAMGLDGLLTSENLPRSR
jgi:hypothetical protein